MKRSGRYWRSVAKTLLQIGLAIAAGQLLLALALFLLAPGRAKAEWLPVRDTDLSIRSGNALDFSALVEAGPAGRFGKVVASPDGHFTFAKAPDKRQRFFCASQPYGIEEGFPDHATADRYAEQLRRHGYNLARFHFVENVLMSGREKDFDFDPEQLDRFHYFMAALKRAGIYWMLDALTSWNGAYGDVGADRWADKRNVKLGVYFDPQDQEHWKRMVDKILAVKNPYTGMAPLQDPALVAVVLVNEGGLNPLLNHQKSPALNRKFSEWLHRRYGSLENAGKKWERHLASGGDAELPHREWSYSSRMADAQRFYYETQASTRQWMTAHLRSRGYQGLVTSYDNWFTLQDIATRAELDLVAAHSYHDEPQAFVSPGSGIRQASSLTDRLAYIRDMTVSRHWNRPYAVTEYDQPFWNRYRYESGLAMGAYAALQDWDLICRHTSGPIELEYGGNRGARHRQLYPYSAGTDPVLRASETLAALLFARRDIKPSPHRTLVRLDADYVFGKQGGIGFLSPDLNQIGLMTGLGVQWRQGDGEPLHADLHLDPDNVDGTRFGKIVRKVSGLLLRDPGDRAQGRIDLLKVSGILPKNNDSSARADRWESDTGQIVLDAARGSLRVTSDRTEALAFTDAPPSGLPRLSVKDASAPSLVAVSALDGAALDKSGRMLLIFASDARNTGMELTNDDKVLRKLGGPPVMIKSARVTLRLKHEQPGELRLYALKLNGERAGELPIKKNGKQLEIVLDMEKLPAGPTTFFELARASAPG